MRTLLILCLLLGFGCAEVARDKPKLECELHEQYPRDIAPCGEWENT